MDRADDKTIALAKVHDFHSVIPLKKNRKFPWFYNKPRYKQRNITERYSLRLKRFRKVFTCYDKLDSMYLSLFSPNFNFFIFSSR